MAAPSANRFGRISPTTAEAVREELGQAIDLVLEGGQCDVGLESTIVDMSSAKPVILRPGMITAQQIEAVLHQHLGAATKSAPRVSGSLESHYAPVTRTRLLSTNEIRNLLDRQPDKCVIMALSEFSELVADVVKMPHTPTAYAHDLYRVLRELDKRGLQQIIIEKVSDDTAWDAIRDRLQIAAV